MAQETTPAENDPTEPAQGGESLITSQIDTAPKPIRWAFLDTSGLITSQIDTAPKPPPVHAPQLRGLITSQIDTAPKQQGQRMEGPLGAPCPGAGRNQAGGSR